MERSEIRDVPAETLFPHSAALHAGYKSVRSPLRREEPQIDQGIASADQHEACHQHQQHRAVQEARACLDRIFYRSAMLFVHRVPPYFTGVNVLYAQGFLVWVPGMRSARCVRSGTYELVDVTPC